MMKSLLAAGAVLALLSAAACDGSSEKAGENLDSAVEETTQGHENLGDGPLERAGENIDNANGQSNNNDAADAVHDATDGNPSTNP